MHRFVQRYTIKFCSQTDRNELLLSCQLGRSGETLFRHREFLFAEHSIQGMRWDDSATRHSWVVQSCIIIYFELQGLILAQGFTGHMRAVSGPFASRSSGSSDVLGRGLEEG